LREFRCDVIKVPMADPDLAASTVIHVIGSGPRLHHVTAIAPGPLETAGDVESLLEAVARALPSAAETVHSKLFVAREGVAAVREALRSCPTLLDVPTSMVLDEPCGGGLIAGVQLLAVEGATSCETVFDGGAPAGRLLELGGARMLLLADIDPGREASTPPAEQMAGMFERAGDLVTRCGFSFRQVVRTWLYLDRLLEVYADLNRIRDVFFERVGVGDPLSAPPASTGIQGAHPSGAAAFMELIALDGAVAVAPMRTPHQCEAYDYGSSFSRGMTAEFAGLGLLFASGTASIDRTGVTVHPGDAHRQIRETYAAVDSLLRHQGASLADVVTGVQFFKDRAAHSAFVELREAAELPALPLVSVYADVCRPELLFELEVTAAGPR